MPKEQDPIFCEPEEVLNLYVPEVRLMAAAVARDQLLLEKMMVHVRTLKGRMAWRCLWVIDHADEQSPGLLSGKVSELVTLLLTSQNSSINRHLTRILVRYTLDEDQCPPVIEKCLQLMYSSDPVAVRVNAMQLLYSMALRFPDFKQELIVSVETMMELKEGSAGLRNRASKLVKALRVNGP